MFTIYAPASIVFHTHLTDEEKVLAMILYRWKNKSNYCFPSRTTLAKYMHCTEKTITVKLNSLIEHKLFEVKRQRRENNKYYYLIPNDINFIMIEFDFLISAHYTVSEKINLIKLRHLIFTNKTNTNTYYITKLGITISEFYTMIGNLVEKGLLDDFLMLPQKEKAESQVQPDIKTIDVKVIDNIKQDEQNIHFYGEVEWEKIQEYMKANHLTDCDTAYMQTRFLEAKKGSPEYLVNYFYKQINQPVNFSNINDFTKKVDAEIKKFGYEEIQYTIDYLVTKNKKTLNFIDKVREEAYSYIQQCKIQAQEQSKTERMDLLGKIQLLQHDYARLVKANLAREKTAEMLQKINDLKEEYNKLYGGIK